MIIDSVVNTMAATLAAFSKAERVTFAGEVDGQARIAVGTCGRIVCAAKMCKTGSSDIRMHLLDAPHHLR